MCERDRMWECVSECVCEREGLCVCVCVCVRERERGSLPAVLTDRHLSNSRVALAVCEEVWLSTGGVITSEVPHVYLADLVA